MANLGRKYTCYSCHTKFYDLNKPVPLCPKCGADQREGDEAPVIPVSRSRKVVEEPVEEPEFEAEEVTEAEDESAEDEEVILEPEPEVEEEEEEEF